jgi:hypothetical protein
MFGIQNEALGQGFTEMVYVRIVWADVTFLKAVFQFKMLGKF